MATTKDDIDQDEDTRNVIEEKIKVVAEALLEKEKQGEICPETRGKLYKITEEDW